MTLTVALATQDCMNSALHVTLLLRAQDVEQFVQQDPYVQNGLVTSWCDAAVCSLPAKLFEAHQAADNHSDPGLC